MDKEEKQSFTEYCDLSGEKEEGQGKFVYSVEISNTNDDDLTVITEFSK